MIIRLRESLGNSKSIGIIHKGPTSSREIKFGRLTKLY
jgi:hypothetical protein